MFQHFINLEQFKCKIASLNHSVIDFKLKSEMCFLETT